MAPLPPSRGDGLVEVPGILDGQTLRRRARLGVIALLARTVLQQFVILGGGIYLARILGPSEFGAFWIVQFALSLFLLFGDAGLGAALIQKKDPPTQEELSSVWWVQLSIAVTVVAVVFTLAPWVVRLWPDLPPSGIWLLRALSLDLLLASLRVMPSILMERELLFARLSVVELVYTVSFYGSAIVLAHLGYGARALVAAVLIQGTATSVVAFALRPWVPSLRLNRAILRPILKFGVAFQTKSVVSFFNGAIIPLYAGGALGRYNLGLVTWSQNTAFFPLKLVEILARVNFPLFSRLQHDPRAFAASLERSIQVCAVVTLFFVGLFFGLGPSIVTVLYQNQWIPAIPMLYVFAAAISIGFLSPIIGGALDAIGKPQIITRLAIYWTILNWISVAVAMAIQKSALAFSVGYCVHILFGNLAVVFVVRKLIPHARFLPRVRAGIVAAIVSGALGRWVFLPWTAGYATLGAAIFLSLLVFVGVLAALDRSAIREVIAMARKA